MDGDIVDDRSSYITYSPSGWERRDAQIADYGGSLSYATLADQSATLTFQGESLTFWLSTRHRSTSFFKLILGIGVAVFGHIMQKNPGISPPFTSYSIDGGPVTTYEESQDDIEHPNQRFYQSPVLPNGQHTIVVTNLWPHVPGGHAAYFLDYFQIVTADNTPLPTPTDVKVVTQTVILTLPISSSATSSPHIGKLHSKVWTVHRTDTLYPFGTIR